MVSFLLVSCMIVLQEDPLGATQDSPPSIPAKATVSVTAVDDVPGQPPAADGPDAPTPESGTMGSPGVLAPEHNGVAAGEDPELPAQPAEPLDFRIRAPADGAVPIKIEVVKESDPESFWKGVLPQLVALGGIILAIITLLLNHKHSARTLALKANEDEIKDIQEKLNSFYGPFRQLLKTSKRLTELFKVGRPDNYRTLVALLEGEIFRGNDAVLLKQIIDVTQRIDHLIIEQSGLIDESLQPLMAQASTHFRLMLLASKGELSGDVDRFKKDVFPLELNGKIEKEIQRLRERKNK